MKKIYRIKTQVPKGGNLSIKGLPFRVGEIVEVTVRVVEDSLRGKYRGRGLMKAFLAGKNQEKEL